MAVRAALTVCTLLAISGPAAWADAAGQTKLEKFAPDVLLSGSGPGGPNEGQTELEKFAPDLLTAKAATLAAAVGDAINDPDNTNSPADLAESALQPVGGKVRSDRDTVAPLIVEDAIGALIFTGTDSSFAADAASIADGVAEVNSGVAKEDLTAGAQAAVVRAALGTIADAYVAGTSTFTQSTLLSADQAIGNKIAIDPALIGLAKNGLTTLLEGAIAGINGVKGRSTGAAPYVAASFVTGILQSGMVPDNATYPAFAVSILTKVAKNTVVDGLVANAIGAAAAEDNSPDLLTLAHTLFAKYPSADARITQGITADIAAGGMNENARIAFIDALTAQQLKQAVQIGEGAAYVDPFYSADFTAGIAGTILTDSGDKTLRADAGKLALGLGAVLAQDPDVLTNVAEVYADLTGSNYLAASESGVYASDLFSAAIKASLSTGVVFKSVTTPTITASVATDLASAADLLAQGIVDSNDLDTPKGLAAAEKELTALAAHMAKFVKNDDVTGTDQPVAVYLAGTLSDYIAGLDLTASIQADLFNSVVKGVTSITDNAVDLQVKSVLTAGSPDYYTNFPAVGAITVQETTTTNM